MKVPDPASPGPEPETVMRILVASGMASLTIIGAMHFAHAI